jgi:hypothetical protein
MNLSHRRKSPLDRQKLPLDRARELYALNQARSSRWVDCVAKSAPTVQCRMDAALLDGAGIPKIASFDDLLHWSASLEAAPVRLCLHVTPRKGAV